MCDYEALGKEIGKLVQEKNEAYGNSFNESGYILRILYPNGVKPEQFDDMLAIIRVVDKLFRIATRKDAFGESPWKDITGYGLLAAARDATKNTESSDVDKLKEWEERIRKALSPVLPIEIKEGYETAC